MLHLQYLALTDEKEKKKGTEPEYSWNTMDVATGE